MKPLIKLLGPIILSLLSCCCWAQSESYKFKPLESEQQFPAQYVWSLVKDHHGFIWYGTSNGLFRFDGYHLKPYPADLADSSKLAHDYIGYLQMDSQGRIWVFSGVGITQGRHVAVIDPQTDHITRIEMNPVTNSILYSQHQSQNLILEDEKGIFWVKCIGTGLYKIQEDKSNSFKVTNYRVSKQYPREIRGDSVSVLFLDDEARFWVGTRNGLYQFNRDDEKYTKLPDNNDHVTAILKHQDKYWVNYEHYGLSTIDPENYTMENKWDESNHTLWWCNWRFILPDKSGNLWMLKQNSPIQSPNNDLDRYEIKNGRNHRYLSDKFVTTYGVDEKGSVWAVTIDSLLYTFDHDADSFRVFSRLNHWSYSLFFDQEGCVWTGGDGLQYYHNSNDKFSKLSDYQVKEYGILTSDEIFEDNSGNILVVANDGYTILKYSVDRGGRLVSKNLLSDPFFKGKTFQHWIKQDSKGNIWGLFKNGTIMEIIKLNNEPYQISYQLKSSLLGQVGITSIESHRGMVLIGTAAGGTIYLNKNGELIHLTHNPNDSSSITSDIWNRVIISSDKTIWIVNQDAFEILDTENGRVDHIYSKIGETFSMIDDIIEAQNNRFWVACTNGLFLFDPKTREVIDHYAPVGGYPIGSVRQIKKDAKDNLWLATTAGLVYFDSKAKSFKFYNQSEGLPSDKVKRLGLRKNGEIVVGTDAGIVIFHPDEVTSNKAPPRPTLTGLKLFNQEVATGSPTLPIGIPYIKELILPHHQNLLSLSYSALSFANPSKNQYAYYLEGLESDWNYVGNQTFANYAGLQPGSYTFNLKASNNDGLWNEEPTQLKITILPPWWKTWWAYSLYALLILGSLVTYYRYQLNRKLEQAETRRLREMDEFKTRFYTNITHEFRTPLTVILGVSDQIGLQYQKAKNLIKRNSLNVLQLVNQLLDLSKLESGMLRLNLQQGDIGKFIKYVAESFHSLAEIKHIDIHFRSEVLKLIMDFDPDKMMNILSNLLSNAIKFTPDTGHISIVLSKSTQQEGEMMVLRVSDTGVGIAKDQLENIFDRFYQVDSSITRTSSGTGIGLALTRELVRLMGGEIRVKSTLYQGTEFTVELPITNEAEMMDRITPQEIVEAPLEKENEVIPPSNGHAGKPVALIVEDSIDVVYYLRTCLQNDYSLRIANNGQEGIEKALEASPDIIISDVMMPEKNGYQLTDTLKNDVKTSHIPIILLTAKATEEDKLEGLGVGADAYLTKPFNVEELKLRIRNLIRERKKLWQHYNQELNYQPQRLSVSSPDQKFLTQALEILEEYKSDSEFNSASLQQELGVSRTLLHVKLKALTGQSTTEFIRTYRLKYAANLLLQDFGNIAEVAYECGFNDQGYFAKSFRKHFGVAPSEYKG